MALLLSLNGLNPGQRYLIPKGCAVLGRDSDCEIVFGFSAISRRHAQITLIDDDYYIEDLQSRNGTFVNGEAVRVRRKLQENDRVMLCDHSFSFLRSLGCAELVDDLTNECGATIVKTVNVASSQGAIRTSGVDSETKLRAILEISRNVGSSLAQGEVLLRILDSLLTIFPHADRAFVVLQDDVDGPVSIRAEQHRFAGGIVPARVSRTIIAKAMQSHEAILSADAASDSRFKTVESSALLRIRSMMCVPIVDTAGRAVGAIQIDALDQRTPFEQEDLDVLASVAGLAALAVEKARVYETALARQALDRDLMMAHDVQQRFLPKHPPRYEGYEFFHFYEAAQQVGGDGFDYIPLPGQRLAVVVADVAGKGISAALLMAKLSAETRYELVSEADPAAALSHINAKWEDRIVTMAIAVIDLANHTVQIVNAGHMPPFLRHNGGEVEQSDVEETGLPLGVDSDFKYRSFSLELAAGDILVMFTDGISEAMDSENALYGIARLEKQLRRDAQCVRQLGEQILDDLRQFVGEQMRNDDMCLLCFGRA